VTRGHDPARPRRPAIGAVPGLLLMASCVAGCSTPGWLCYLPPGPSTITLIAEPDANADSAIAVDLVFVSDKTVAQQIATLPAQQYFARRDQLERDFPTGFQVRSWQLAPGQVARQAPTDPTCNRVATLLFVRLSSPGDHRMALATSGSPVVSMNSQDFKVTP
jgi:type VI secretion system protein